MWNLYNLISKRDIVKGLILRKVTKENVTGMVDSKKKKINAMIWVEKIEFDGESDKMRVFGTNAGESEYMKRGAHQAMEIFPPKKIVLIKPWFDEMHIERL